MPSAEEIKVQQTLLATYRGTLAVQLNQRATLGAAHAPPGLINGILEARDQIARIKSVLRRWEVDVSDGPNDEESPAPSIAGRFAQSTQPGEPTFIFNAPIHSGSTYIGGKQQIGEMKITIGDSFDFSDANLSNSNNNFKSSLSSVMQIVGSLPNASADQKQQIEQLLKALGVELEKAPSEHKDDAEAIEELAKELLKKATKARPNKPTITITAEGLRQAAQNIADVLPAVLPIASQIVTHILTMVK
jgi:hypothetical protein